MDTKIEPLCTEPSICSSSNIYQQTMCNKSVHIKAWNWRQKGSKKGSILLASGVQCWIKKAWGQWANFPQGRSWFLCRWVFWHCRLGNGKHISPVKNPCYLVKWFRNRQRKSRGRLANIGSFQWLLFKGGWHVVSFAKRQSECYFWIRFSMTGLARSNQSESPGTAPKTQHPHHYQWGMSRN